MKLVVYPDEVIPFDDFVQGSRSDDYTVIDLESTVQKVQIELNNQQTPIGWHLIKLTTTPYSKVVKNDEDPITVRTFEVPLTANGHTFTAVAEVTYDHVYHTVDVNWWPSFEEWDSID